MSSKVEKQTNERKEDCLLYGWLAGKAGWGWLNLAGSGWLAGWLSLAGKAGSGWQGWLAGWLGLAGWLAQR
eukprot:15178021-Heterocapsa_arctica.AAC.1